MGGVFLEEVWEADEAGESVLKTIQFDASHCGGLLYGKGARAAIHSDP